MVEKCIHPMMMGREQNQIRDKIQEEMVKDGLEYLVLCRCDNIFYATGFRGVFAYQSAPISGNTIVLVPAEGPISLIVNSLETDSALTMSTDVEVREFMSWAFIDDGSQECLKDKGDIIDPHGAASVVVDILKSKHSCGKIGIESQFITNNMYSYLESQIGADRMVNLEDTHVITVTGHESFTCMPSTIYWDN